VANRTHRVTAHARKCFIEALRQTGNVSEACRLSGNPGFTRRHAYRMKDKDPAFAAAWEEAEEIAIDALELEARRRAVEGVAKPLVSMGKPIKGDDGKIIEVREYSDHLMLSLLKGHRPEKYRENISFTGTMTIELSARMDAAIRRLAAPEQHPSLPAPKVIDVEGDDRLPEAADLLRDLVAQVEGTA
jgi:hypothetical protein